MKAKGFESYRSNGVMRWRGIGLAHENGTEGEGGEAYADPHAHVWCQP